MGLHLVGQQPAADRARPGSKGRRGCRDLAQRCVRDRSCRCAEPRSARQLRRWQAPPSRSPEPAGPATSERPARVQPGDSVSPSVGRSPMASRAQVPRRIAMRVGVRSAGASFRVAWKREDCLAVSPNSTFRDHCGPPPMTRTSIVSAKPEAPGALWQRNFVDPVRFCAMSIRVSARPHVLRMPTDCTQHESSLDRCSNCNLICTMYFKIYIHASNRRHLRTINLGEIH